MSQTYPAVSWCGQDDDLLDTLPSTIPHIEMEDAVEDNTTRAMYAALAVKRFGERVAPGGEETETLVGDLLANLMHLCDAAGISFEECLANGRMHYDAEVTAEDYCSDNCIHNAPDTKAKP